MASSEDLETRSSVLKTNYQVKWSTNPRWLRSTKQVTVTHSNPPSLRTAIQVPANWRPWLQGLRPDWARPARMPLHPGSLQGVGQPAKVLTCPSEGLVEVRYVIFPMIFFGILELLSCVHIQNIRFIHAHGNTLHTHLNK